MKNKFLLFLVLIVPFFLNAQIQQWEVLNPKPSYNFGYDVEFISQQTGFIITKKELLETTNGGSQWHFKQELYNANDISFKNGKGYIIGDYGYVLKSIDSGTTWESINTGLTENLTNVSILDDNNIIISGTTKICRSTDGGDNWQIINITGLNSTIRKSFFTNTLTGHVACQNGRIMKTIDGGENWYVTETVNTIPSEYNALVFVDDNIGYAAREHDDVLKTTNGGESWELLQNGPSMSIYCFYFTDANTGYAGGENGALFKTSNGGNTWTDINPDNSYIYANEIYGLYFNGSTGYAVGGRGRILKTTNSGSSWSKYARTYETITQLSFTSSARAIAVAGNKFFKTSNTGQTWQSAGTISNLYGTVSQFDFIDDQTGFAACGELVYNTTDGGQTWTPLPNSELDEGIYSIDFVDQNTGFISGGFNSPRLKKTTDGGLTWQTLNNLRFGEIQFLTPLIGYARNTGSSYILYKTTDGGITWTNILQSEGDEMTSFHFVNENIGYLTGYPGVAYKTVDGGGSWVPIEMPYEFFRKIRFINADTGYAAADYGKLYKTTDGGNQWSYEGTFPEINDITFKDGNIYLAGLYGVILRNGTGALSDGDLTYPSEMITVYPNPADTEINIVAGNNHDIQNITINDIAGRKIFSADCASGSVRIDITGKSSGIYLVTITLDNNIVINKKILIH